MQCANWVLWPNVKVELEPEIVRVAQDVSSLISRVAGCRPPQASEEALEAQASRTSWPTPAWSGDILRNRFYHVLPTSGMDWIKLKHAYSIIQWHFHEETSSAGAGKIKANDDRTTCFTRHDSRSSEKKTHSRALILVASISKPWTTGNYDLRKQPRPSCKLIRLVNSDSTVDESGKFTCMCIHYNHVTYIYK